MTEALGVEIDLDKDWISGVVGWVRVADQRVAAFDDPSGVV